MLSKNIHSPEKLNTVSSKTGVTVRLHLPFETFAATGANNPNTCPVINAVTEASPVPSLKSTSSLFIFACLFTILKIGALCFFAFLLDLKRYRV